MAKSSKKAHQTPPSPPPTARGRTTLLVASVAALGLVLVALAYVATDRSQPAAPLEAAPATIAPITPAAAPPRPVAQQPTVALKAHPQKDFPPLRLPGYPLGRSPDMITAAYRFAAEHPEILTYVPCFCGCERSGHGGNEDCFVKSRATNGDVQEWEDHGMECNVCVDVATQAMQMYASGASVRDIRAAVETKWSSQLQSHTPTPDPPK